MPRSAKGENCGGPLQVLLCVPVASSGPPIRWAFFFFKFLFVLMPVGVRQLNKEYKNVAAKKMHVEDNSIATTQDPYNVSTENPGCEQCTPKKVASTDGKSENNFLSMGLRLLF